MKVIITMFNFKDNRINWFDSKIVLPPDDWNNWQTFVENYKKYITARGRAEIRDFRCEGHKAYLLVVEKDVKHFKNIIIKEYDPCEIQID